MATNCSKGAHTGTYRHRLPVSVYVSIERDTKNLRKKSEQHEAALRKLNDKHDIEVPALKNKIKRLEDLEQLEKAESECAQAKDENATLRQMIAQLEAESASKNKNDNITVEAEKARIKENNSKMRERRSLKLKTRS
nr:unnamed protein product [Callosobruchus chinensis]